MDLDLSVWHLELLGVVSLGVWVEDPPLLDCETVNLAESNAVIVPMFLEEFDRNGSQRMRQPATVQFEIVLAKFRHRLEMQRTDFGVAHGVGFELRWVIDEIEIHVRFVRDVLTIDLLAA